MTEYERCPAPNPEELWVNHRPELARRSMLQQLMVRLLRHQHRWVDIMKAAEAEVDFGRAELGATFGNALLRAFEGVQDSLGNPAMRQPEKEHHAHKGVTYLALSSFVGFPQHSGEFRDGAGMGHADTLPEFNRDEAGFAIARLHSLIEHNDTLFEDSRGEEPIVWYRSSGLYVSREPSVPDERVLAHLAKHNVEVDFSQLEALTPYMRYQ